MSSPQGGTSCAHLYARIPVDVLFDGRLSPCDRLVYAALAFQCFQGSTAAIGTRTVAKKLGISRQQVQRSLPILENLGHIQKAEERIRGRAVYVLTSPVFGQKQGKETIVDAGPSGGRRLVSLDREEVA